MPLSRLNSVALIGLDATLIDIEVDVSPAKEHTTLILVGLPDAAVRESKDRVLSAIKNSAFRLETSYCVVNLAPGDLKKEGAIYDLPIALGLLRSAAILPNADWHRDFLIVGELGLSGELRPIQGALSIGMLAKDLGKKGVILPAVNAREAAAVPNIKVIPVNTLAEAAKFLFDASYIQPLVSQLSESIFQKVIPTIDFADIKGQQHVKRALEICAAGGHNVVLCGPPGSGKTMIAKALIGIMPELTVQEALETTKIHSVAGLLQTSKGIITERPFRSPHHTISYAGLIGGGVFPRPGEVSLAHNGILFLDELPEFSRTVLEVLRQPLEDRKVTISRANGNVTFPTSFICVGAMNPCPCGMLGHPKKACIDTELQINRYRNKISGPLWDRIDLHIEVPALSYQDMQENLPGETSAVIRKRVMDARANQLKWRQQQYTNAQLTANDLKKSAILNSQCHELLRYAIDTLGISARACDRLIRVSRTIADLAGSPNIHSDHLMEAITFRNMRVPSTP